MLARNCSGSKKSVRNLLLLFIIGVLINIGMWSERFVIVVGSLYQDFLPANWGKYMPTRWDIGLYIGTLGAFFMLYLLFVKFLPVIAISEVKSVMPEADPHHPLGGAKSGGEKMSAAANGKFTASWRNLIRRRRSFARRKKSATPATVVGTRFTPFPIHGMDKVMKLGNSLVGWVSLAMGAGAFLSVAGLIWFANAFDYPLIVGGKPMFSVPMTFVPSPASCSIMGAAVGSLIRNARALNQLPRLHHPLLCKKHFELASRDKFFLVIGATDPKFSVTETKKMLESISGAKIEIVEDED